MQRTARKKFLGFVIDPPITCFVTIVEEQSEHNGVPRDKDNDLSGHIERRTQERDVDECLRSNDY